MLITVASFLVVLSLLVFVHELGHFLVAKRSGIVVEEFGFGYPPRIRTLFYWRGTPVSLNAIPFGGFVRMKGEDGQEGPGSFVSQSKRIRALTLLAGPAMNFLLALVFFTLAFLLGWPEVQAGARIKEVVAGAPADLAGLRPNDIVLQVDGQPVRQLEDLTTYTDAHRGTEITLTVRRQGEELTVRVVPRVNPPVGEGAMGIAIGPVTGIRRSPLPEAMVRSVEATGRFIFLTLSVPVMIIRGLIPVSEARPIGPVGIAVLAGDAMQATFALGWWFPILQLMAILSAALAVTNLLPLPALDGGRLLFIAIETLRGRRIDPEREGTIHLIGFALLLTLMLLITYQDIVSPVPRLDWSNLGL
jgi:regulator of sigma E protease